MIAAIGGVVVGLFNNLNIGQGASLSPFGIAFLVGYASESVLLVPGWLAPVNYQAEGFLVRSETDLGRRR